MGAVSEIKTVKDKQAVQKKRNSTKLRRAKSKLRREAKRMEDMRQELV